MCLSDWKIVADIAKELATIIAILVAGLWTYFLFVRNRLNYPIVKINIEPQIISLPSKKVLIHAKVHITNIGKVILKSTAAELRLRSVVPLPSTVQEDAIEGYDPVPENETEIPWPQIADRQWKWEEGRFEIEPEEDGNLYCDFIIDESISVVQLYCFINNASKQDLGWSTTLVHKLNNEEE